MLQTQNLKNKHQQLHHIFIKVIGFCLILVFLLITLIDKRSPANAQSGTCTADFQSVAIPLNDLGNNEYIRMDGQQTGFIGGLYPGGSNVPPTAHQSAALAQANAIVPLDASGNPDATNGKIVMISIGMSNANYEFYTFMTHVIPDTTVNPQLLLINGALPGQTSDVWADPGADAWNQLAATLESYQVTAQQVQVAWIKNTRTGAGDFPEKALALQSDFERTVQNLKALYPNVKIAYLSSRIYSYTYINGLSPEPNAYETGFAVKWLISKQINGAPALNSNPQNGPVMAPLLLWGPYLWANGNIPRSDGLVWLPEDLTNDCTHPSDSGRQKVAQLLIDFFKNDSTTTPWFMIENPNEYQIYIPLLIQSIATQPETINNEKNVQISIRTGEPAEIDRDSLMLFQWLKSNLK